MAWWLLGIAGAAVASRALSTDDTTTNDAEEEAPQATAYERTAVEDERKSAEAEMRQKRRYCAKCGVPTSRKRGCVLHPGAGTKKTKAEVLKAYGIDISGM